MLGGMTITVPAPRTDTALATLAAGRIVLGALALAAPGPLVRRFGMRSSPELEYMTRIFGGRAVALGAGYLTEPEDQRGRWHRLGLFVDVSDTATALDHLARKDLPRPATAALLALTGSYALVGALRLARPRSFGDPAR